MTIGSGMTSLQFHGRFTSFYSIGIFLFFLLWQFVGSKTFAVALLKSLFLFFVFWFAFFSRAFTLFRSLVPFVFCFCFCFVFFSCKNVFYIVINNFPGVQASGVIIDGLFILLQYLHFVDTGADQI